MQPTSPGRQALLTLGGAVLVFGALYLARTVLIPIALGILLTLLLTPAVDRLERLRLGKTAPVLIVIVLAFGVLGGLGWIVGTQASALASHLPDQKQNILDKIDQIKLSGPGPFAPRLQQSLDEIRSALAEKNGAPEGETGNRPIPVELKEDGWTFYSSVPSLLEILARACFVVILVVFMLLNRRELRNRLIRLMGDRELPLMTKAMDETGDRISRFLLAQFLINATNGAIVGIGLAVIGVPYPVLFGVIAAAMRFVPYFGSWIAAFLPVVTSLAASPGWTQPLLVIALFAMLDLVGYMALEPVVFSRSIGVTALGLLIAVAFWTWLWGPIGLLLATPLTVCIVVASKHIPQLRFLGLLIGDEPAMDAGTRFYQRLLARDPDEALQVVDEYLKKAEDPERLHDEVLLPTLNALKRDRNGTQVTQEDVDYVVRATGRILDLVEMRQQGAKGRNGQAAPAASASMLIGYAAVDEIDVLALRMLQQVMGDGAMKILGDDLLLSEVLAHVEESEPRVVCIAACPPDGLTQCRYIVKRLRARFPKLRIILGRFGGSSEALPTGADADDGQLTAEGADSIATTLLDGRKQISELIHLVPAA